VGIYLSKFICPFPLGQLHDRITAEINYWPYRREIKRLRDDHPLFAARLDIPVADFEDFMTETLLLPSMLQKIDPVGFFALGVLLDQVLQREDDGSALFLLDAAQELLHVLEEPICTQIYLRNILEMAFDGRERATQKERSEKLCQIYPQIGRLCDPASLPDVEQGQRVFRANSVFGLRMLELALYFQQDKQRIARCDYCWNYFIPKTKARVLYCDRIFDGQSCKKQGANLKRRKGPEQDDALKLFKQLRDRMYARMLRYQDAPENQRGRLIPMMPAQYDEWEANARQARREYMAGKIKAEEFLRRIDTTRELTSYDTIKQELPPEESVWQKRVAADLGFDPEQDYPASFMALDLGEDIDDPQWQHFTRADLIQKDQEGHQSLREKYGKQSPASSYKPEKE